MQLLLVCPLNQDTHNTVQPFCRILHIFVSLHSLVHKWTTGLLQDAEIQAQLQRYEGYLHAAFEYAGAKPVVTGISPTCIAPSRKHTHLSIQCSGFFPEGADPLLSPIFIYNEQ